MRPLLDVLTDEKEIMNNIKIVMEMLENPESKLDKDTLNDYLDSLYVQLTKVRKEVRFYFNQMHL